MAIIQLVLTALFNVSPLITLSFLPGMIFCIPTARPTSVVMVEAFILGMLVDVMAEGPVGLNAASLTLVALSQKSIIALILDKDLVERKYSFSYHRYGYLKIGFCLIIASFIFFCAFVFLDSAGTRSFGFNLSRVALSTICSLPFNMVVAGVLAPKQKR